jgi:hypothetical protein
MRSEFKDAVDQSKPFGIQRHKAFGVHLSEGHMQRPLLVCHLAQTVERQVNTLTNANSGEAHQQESIGIQTVGAAQFLLE